MSLSGLSDKELAEYTTLQERIRDCGEPDAQKCAVDKLKDLYAELEARRKRDRFRVV